MLGLVSVIPVCLTEIAGVACFSPRREISSFIITPILLFEDVKKLTARRLVPEKLRWWSRLLCCTRILPKHWKSFSHLAVNLCGVTSHSAHTQTLYYITHKYLPMILSVHWCISISICCVQTSFLLSFIMVNVFSGQSHVKTIQNPPIRHSLLSSHTTTPSSTLLWYFFYFVISSGDRRETK